MGQEKKLQIIRSVNIFTPPEQDVDHDFFMVRVTPSEESRETQNLPPIVAEARVQWGTRPWWPFSEMYRLLVGGGSTDIYFHPLQRFSTEGDAAGYAEAWLRFVDRFSHTLPEGWTYSLEGPILFAQEPREVATERQALPHTQGEHVTYGSLQLPKAVLLPANAIQEKIQAMLFPGMAVTSLVAVQSDVVLLYRREFGLHPPKIKVWVDARGHDIVEFITSPSSPVYEVQYFGRAHPGIVVLVYTEKRKGVDMGSLMRNGGKQVLEKVFDFD